MPTVTHPFCPSCGTRYAMLTWSTLDPYGVELRCHCGHVWQVETVGVVSPGAMEFLNVEWRDEDDQAGGG